MKNVLLLFLALGWVPAAFAQSALPSSAPESNSFSLNPEELGKGVSTVNLFTGEVHYPVSLGSVSSRNGLQATLTASYSSAGSEKAYTTWNREAPTGIMGFGWNFPHMKIVADNKQTGSREDDTYYLIEGGSSMRLHRIGTGTTSRSYATDNYQFWVITFNTSTDVWTIVKEDGTTYTYGGTTASREQVVRWGNWIGHSNQTGNQQQQTQAWHLSEIQNVLGNKITYAYTKVENKVGGSTGKLHTEAIYLSSITSDVGSSIVLTYTTKTASEYYEPHTAQSEPDAYQEKYEKQFLSHIDHYNYYGVKLSTTRFTYQIIGSGDLSKRILTKIHSEDIHGYASPGTVFTYHTGTGWKGKLQTVTDPLGETITYTYSSTLKLAGNSTRDLTVNAPTGGYKDPKVWFGRDYVVVGWRQINNGDPLSIKLYVYTWKGYWQAEYETDIPNVRHKDGFWERFHVATGDDFFGVSAHINSAGIKYNTYLFHRNKGNDTWAKIATPFTEDTGGEPDDAGRPTFHAGNNFLALTPFNKAEIFTYIFLGDSWQRKIITRTGTGWFASAATNNYIIDHNRHGTDYIRLYYLDETLNWQTKTLSSPFQSDHLDQSFLYPSNSFTTILGSLFQEYIYSWDENYNSLSNPFALTGVYSDQSRIFNVANSLTGIANLIGSGLFGGPPYYNKSKSARYNGSNFVSSSEINSFSENGLSFGDDFFLYDVSSTKSKHVLFNPNNGTWTTSADITYTGSGDFIDGTNPLQAGNGHAIIFDKFYRKEANNTFVSPAGSAGTLTTPSAERIYVPSMAAGANFYIYLIKNSSGVFTGQHRIQFIKNGQLGMSRYINGYHFGINTFGQDEYPYIWNKLINSVSGDMYVTYPQMNDVQYSTSITLHKVIEDNAIGAVGTYPVTSIAVSNGVTTQHTAFDYELSSAVVDMSGQVAQYNKVTVVPGSSNPATKPFGHVESWFYNKAEAASIGKALVGVNYATSAYDIDGVEQSYKGQSFTSYTKSVTAGTTSFSLHYVRPTSQTSRMYGVSTSTALTYDVQTGQKKSESISYYNSQGFPEFKKTEYVYWWEKYDVSRTKNLLISPVQVKSLIGSSVVQVAVSTFRGTGYLTPHRSFDWKGTGSSDFPNFTSETVEPADWILSSTITQTDTYNQPTETKDVEGFFSSTVYGHKGLIPIGTFSNAENAEIMAENFDDNVLLSGYPGRWTLSSSWTNTGKTLNFTGAAGHAYMNKANVGADRIFEFRAKRATTGSGWIGFNFRKASSGTFEGISLRLTTTALQIFNGTTQLTSVSAENTGNWKYYRLLIEGNQLRVYSDGKRILTWTLPTPLGNNWSFYSSGLSGSIDDFRAYPVDAQASSLGVDELYMSTEKETGPTGRTTYMLLDDGAPVASVDNEGFIQSSQSTYVPVLDGLAITESQPVISHSSYSKGAFGFHSSFTDLTGWTTLDRSNGFTAGWTIQNERLRVTRTGTASSQTTDMLHRSFTPVTQGELVVEASLRVKTMPGGFDLGLALGGDQWNLTEGGSENAMWLALEGNILKVKTSVWTNLKTGIQPNRTYRIKVRVDLATQKAHYYVDGKLLLTDQPLRMATNDISKLALLHYGVGAISSESFVDNLVIYDEPVESSVFSDASGATRQEILRENATDIIVTEYLFDGLGRPYIQTLPTRMTGSLSYQAGFVTSFTVSTGVMAGTVVTNNAGNTYPYTRTKYPDAAPDRYVETSIPGSGYTIGSGKNTRMLNTKNQSSGVPAMGTEFPLNHYFVSETISPDGGKVYQYSDKTGRPVMVKKGTITGNEEQPVYSNTTVNAGNTFTFVPAINHQVSYNYQDKSNPEYSLRIGTSAGSANIVNSTVDRIGTFTAYKGTTYYVEVKYTAAPPAPVYYDYNCINVVVYNPAHCYSAQNCRINCPFELQGCELEPCEQTQLQASEMKQQLSGLESDSLLGGSMEENLTPFVQQSEIIEENILSGGQQMMMGGPTILPEVTLDYSVSTQLVQGQIYATTKFEYDAKGNLINQYPPNYFNPMNASDNPAGYVITHSYNAQNRLASTQSSDKGTTRYIYETKTGRLRFFQDQNGIDAGKIIYIKYDVFGRETEKGFFTATWNASTLQTSADTSPAYPTSGTTWRIKTFYAPHGEYTASYNSVTSIETNNDTDVAAEIIERFTYDEFGQVLTSELEFTESLYSHAFTYNYNIRGKLISEDYGEGPGLIIYTYDNLDRLTGVGMAGTPYKYARFVYDNNGKMSQEILNNGGITRTFTYNQQQRLTRISDNHFQEDIDYSNGYGGRAFSSGLFGKTTYDYKNITSFGGFADAYNNAYDYDNLGQLIRADNSVNAAWDVGIGIGKETRYHPNGNIAFMRKGTTDKTYTYDAGKNQLNRTSGSTRQYSYDGNGNITASTPKNLTLTYDLFFNKSLLITYGSNSTKIMLQSDGERVYKKVTTGTNWNETYYMRGAGAYPLIEKYQDQSGNQSTKYFIYGPSGLIAFITSSNTMLTSMATLEENTIQAESQLFEIDEGHGQVVNAELFNHTDSTGAKYSLRLSGLEGEQQGFGHTIRVAKGDTLRSEVFAKYIALKEDPKVAALLIAMGMLPPVSGAGTITEGAGAYSNAFTSNPIATGGAKSESILPEVYLNYILMDTLGQFVEAGYVPMSGAAAEDGSDVAHEKLQIEKVASQDGYIYTFVTNESDQPQDVFFDDMTMSLLVSDQTYFYSKDHLGSTRILIRDDNSVVARYDYDVYGNVTRYAGSETIAYLYTGQEFDSELGLHNFRARFYDGDIGIFYGMDPAEQFASGYLGMGNNPVMMVDPDGEIAFVVLATMLGKAALVGAGISSVAYTASVGFSEGGFDNWDWGNFGTSAAIGAVSGAATAGIGKLFGAVGGNATTTIGKVTHEVSRATAHGLVNVGVQSVFGNPVNFGTFSLAAGSSLVGSGTQSLNLGGLATVGTSALTGGLFSELSGGDFWQGAGVGATIAGLNHLGQEIQDDFGPIGRKRDINKMSYEQIILKLRKAHIWMSKHDENLYFEDIFKPKGFETPNAMKIAGMSTRSKFFHPNGVTMRLSTSLREEITHADGLYSFSDAANQFGNQVTRPFELTRALRIGILNNENKTNLMTIDILSQSPAARSYMECLRNFILGE